MNKSILSTILSVFHNTNLGIKKPTRSWEHSDERVTKAEAKRLRKNKRRLGETK